MTTIAWQSDAVLVDSPTNGTASTGADPGGEVVGNYAVLNPLNSYSNTTLSKGNLRINSGNNWGSCHSTLALIQENIIMNLQQMQINMFT